MSIVSVAYLLGITFAILAGAMNALGAILQKSAVNRIIARAQGSSFTAQFVRDPVWIAGLVASMGLGTFFNLSSQSRIGPALVPGLTASGMILLAIGSARLLGEKLKRSEWIGIILLVFGVASLGLSGLDIPKSEVDLLNKETQIRLVAFSAALLLCWWLSWLLAKQARSVSRGLLTAISAGLPFCLSNLWILPMLITIGPVFSGAAQAAEFLIFMAACIILVGTNLLGIRQTQESYRFAPASKAQPIQQVPTQIIPILIYLFVFQRAITGTAIILVPLGVALILAGGFLLGKRRGELNREDAKNTKMFQ